MNKAGIYKIINAVNNKFYVGSAVDFKQRKARHWWRLRRGDHSNKHLQAAWIKYGEAAFTFVVVQEIVDLNELLAAENVWLSEHVGKDYCYNIATDATAPTRGWFGDKNPMWGKTFNHTPEAVEVIRQHSRTRTHTPESRQKIRSYLIGKPRPAAVRAKIAASVSGERNPNYGKPRDAGFLAKVSHRVVCISPAGEATLYPSIKALREAMGLNPPTVNRALKSGRALTRGPYTGWIFRAVDTPLDRAYTEASGKIRPPDSPD